MKSREQERDERRRYEGDVAYEVWRSGRDADRISHDRMESHYYAGDSAQAAANHEIRLQRQQEEARQQERWEDEEQGRQYYEQQQDEQAQQEPGATP